MSYFDDETNVDGYLRMVEGYDGAPLMAEVAKHLPAGASVLELGMGGGDDLDRLTSAGFAATGSDASEVFLRRYAERGGQSPTLCLDALTLDTEQRFDAIFSNKVMQHLTREEVAASLARQAKVIQRDGHIFHTLWHGDSDEKHHGLHFSYFRLESFRARVPDSLEIVAHRVYRESEEGDSLWVLLRRTDRHRPANVGA
jgi:2-polyprenyl-3-methyl-5-hydroxy-6-metoxy-1,4-benzoquinol methylase